MPNVVRWLMHGREPDEAGSISKYSVADTFALDGGNQPNESPVVYIETGLLTGVKVVEEDGGPNGTNKGRTLRVARPPAALARGQSGAMNDLPPSSPAAPTSTWGTRPR